MFQSSHQPMMVQQKRGLKLPHLSLKVLRKPCDRDVTKAAHAYSAGAALLRPITIESFSGSQR